MFKVSSCFPNKTKDKAASTQSFMSISMPFFNPNIPHGKKLQKNSSKSKNLSLIKMLQSVRNNLEKRSSHNIKKSFDPHPKDTFYKIEDQVRSKKQKNIFRINGKKQSLDCLIIDHRRKLREQKHFPGPQELKSSNLSQLYSKLYESYEKVPFDEYVKQQPKVQNNQQRASQLTLEQKQKETKKQFEVKDVMWQNNLRKEIKSLARDTDFILNMEFQVRDIGRR